MDILTIIGLMIAGQFQNMQYTTVQHWQGGTMISAPPAFGEAFYDAETITVFSDGESVEYRLYQRTVLPPDGDWEAIMDEYSYPGDITLVTCYPRGRSSAWLLISQFEPTAPVQFDPPATPMPSKPPYCKLFIQWREVYF